MGLKEKLLIYPTDTVWGIGACIDNEALHQKIAQVKRVSDDKPVSILYTSFKELLFDFDLPLNNQRDEHWWLRFFSMETTLALNLKRAKRSIPKWITHQSPLIAVRLNESPDLQELRGIGPISTTSLNLHGEPPMQDENLASEFTKKYAPEAHFVQSHSQVLSGRASTIVNYSDDDQISFLREGGLIQNVREHLGLSPT